MCCKCPHVPESTAAALAEKLTALGLNFAHRRRPSSALVTLGVGALDVSSDALRRLEGRDALGAAEGCGQNSALGCVISFSATSVYFASSGFCQMVTSTY